MAEKRIWLCGPILGVAELNVPAFEKVSETVELFGFQPVNPILDPGLIALALELEKSGASREKWLEYITRKLLVMATCDGVYLFGQVEGLINIETQIEALSAIQLGMEMFKD